MNYKTQLEVSLYKDESPVSIILSIQRNSNNKIFKIAAMADILDFRLV